MSAELYTAPQLSAIEEAQQMSQWLPDFVYGVTDDIEPLPKIMEERLLSIYGDMDFTEAMKRVREAMVLFGTDPDDEHNFALFISGYPVDMIHQLGLGDVAESLARIQDRLISKAHPDANPSLSAERPQRVQVKAARRIGGSAARNVVHLPLPIPMGRPQLDLATKVVMPVDYLIRDDSTNQMWQERALCSQTDPEAFFPEKGGSTREAKRVCLGCEVKNECLEHALQNGERFGIWGGLSERERRRLQKGIVGPPALPKERYETVDPMKIAVEFHTRHKANDRLNQLLSILADEYEDQTEYDDELAYDYDKLFIVAQYAIYGVFAQMAATEQHPDRLQRLLKYFTMDETDVDQRWMYENERLLCADIEHFGLTLEVAKQHKDEAEDATLLESCIARLTDRNARSMVANYVAPLPEWMKQLKRGYHSGEGTVHNTAM